MTNKEIYIIIMRTPSVVSKIIGKFTHTQYNHISVSLDAGLDHMFSFGRRYKYIPWIGGFVQESPNFGTLKRFSETDAIILTLNVDDGTYNDIRGKLEDMLAHKYSYRYDTLGLLLGIFGKTHKRNRCYYCSAFVRELLVEFGIEGSDNFEEIVRPMDFLNLPNTSEIYRGKLREFSGQAERIRLR